jgi:hypothetical protein
MSSDWIVEAVNVTANRFFGLPSCLEACAPDQLRFDCLEDCFNDGIIIAVPLAAHRRDHAGPFNEPAIVVGTLLAAPVGMDLPRIYSVSLIRYFVIKENDHETQTQRRIQT